MKTGLSNDDKQDHSIARNGNGIEAAKGDGDPNVRSLKTRDASQEKDCRVENALVKV